MNHTATRKQAEALALIEDNPGRVEAGIRTRGDALHVHGIVERALARNGWVHDQGGAWHLTQAGADALRDHTLAHQG
jgi:hypothetical protein